MIIKAFDMAFVTEALHMDNLDGEDPFSGLSYEHQNTIYHSLPSFYVSTMTSEILKQFVRNKGKKLSEFILSENTLSENFD